MEYRKITTDFDFQGFRFKECDIITISKNNDIHVFYILNESITVKGFNFIIDTEKQLFISKSEQIEELLWN